MKTMAVAFILAAFAATAHAGMASPVGKVIQLLSDMETKIISEGEESHTTYTKTSEWCEERSKNLGFEIKTAKAQISALKATIDEETALTGSLNSKVDSLTSSIATDEADLKAATTIRKKEAADFAAEEKELVEVIDSLRRAIGILEKEMQQGGASMMQLQRAGSLTQAIDILVQSAALNSADGGRLTAMIQSGDAEDDAGAPAATVYEGHSGGIIDTLEGLLDKAQSQLADARKKETSALHNFEMLEQSLQDEIKFASNDVSKAKSAIAESGEKKSTAEGDVQVTTKDLQGDVESLGDLHQTCLTKAQDYEAETKSRSEELKALASAKKVISESTASAEGLSYGLNQISFIQKASLTSGTDLANFEAVHVVRGLARRMRSTELAQLASKMAAAMHMGDSSGDDPFAKVKGLISDMIERLESEADADASHKAYCDKEISESSQKKADKNAEIEKMSAKIDQMSARSSQLKEEVAGLQKALANLAAAGADMDKMRRQEHEDYTKNKADMEQGLEGVKLALKVLRDYYGKDKAHAAEEGAGTSVIGLLEVVESDFSKTLAEMTATEETSQAAYEKQTKQSEVEKASKDQDVAYKAKEATSLDKAVSEATSDRAGVQSELDAVQQYLDTLDKECSERAETYAERKARFEAEIEGLKEALRVLESEAVLLQRGTKRSLRGVKKHL